MCINKNERIYTGSTHCFFDNLYHSDGGGDDENEDNDHIKNHFDEDKDNNAVKMNVNNVVYHSVYDFDSLHCSDSNLDVCDVFEHVCHTYDLINAY